MIAELANKKQVSIRQWQPADAEALFIYLQGLSPESRSRFGPHAFDKETVSNICNNQIPGWEGYLALDNSNGNILAYMLICQGMIEWDEKRYAQRNISFDTSSTVTFAPSVGDAWQSTGLGTLMNNFIESELKKRGIKSIVLWGGVQASNKKAVNFYKKHHYQYISTFRNNEMDNFDMVKYL
jgi:GNAT superfamily N-acetyltransferase